jgi:uncharacterized protein
MARGPNHSSNWGGARPRTGTPRKVPAEVKQQQAGFDPRLLATMIPQIIEASQASAKRVSRDTVRNPFAIAMHPPRAMPRDKALHMAMDESLNWAAQAWANGGPVDAFSLEGMLFPGFAYLAELAQRPEYRIISETIADDATRKWIKFEVTGDEKEMKRRRDEDAADPDGAGERSEARIAAVGKTDKVKALKDELERLELRDKCYSLVRDDGFFGRGHLYLDFGVAIGDGMTTGAAADELKTPVGDGRDEISKSKVAKGMLRDVRVIEAVWAYPTTYNAANPLSPDFYRPKVWYVMGQEIDRSRLLSFVGRPVPDILKPAYSFGGLSLSQLAEPYVNIWLRTRGSIADLIHSFSVMVLMTDLQTILQPGNASSLLARAALFNTLRDNQGLMILNKEKEEMKNITTPLSGLDDLQAQAQEHMTFPSRIPMVKFTGIQPKGLNASSEGEIRVYYDTIAGGPQNRFLRPNLTRVINFVQLHLWGEIDPEITYEFEPLWEMSQKEKSEKEKADADRDEKYVNMGALDPAEVRKRIVDDPDLPYTDIDPDDVPEPPQPEGGGEPFGGEPSGDPDLGGDPSPAREGAQDRRPPFAVDALFAHDEWHESDHPRGQPGNPGQFGPGGGSAASPKAGKKAAASTGGGGVSKAPLKPTSLTKVGEKMGSNAGGTFKDAASGKTFYIKKPGTKAHVTNELLGAKLYALAGAGQTLDYHPVEGGEHVATEIAKLDKKNIGDFTPAEKKAAQADFMTQAWIGNWDAAGTGGDNKGILNGEPTALDFGGALEYRAQGEPKGDAFGDDVPEIETMRDKDTSPDNAKLYGGMTEAELRSSAKHVTNLTNDTIITAVKEAGGTATLAEKLIARKNFIAHEFGLPTDTSEWDEEKHPRNPDGTFATGGGGAGGPEDPAPAEGKGGEGWETIKSPLIKQGATPQQTYALTLANAMKAPAIAGSNYRRLLMKLIKENAQQGGHESQVAKLKVKLVQSLGQTRENLLKKYVNESDPKAADKVLGEADKVLAKMKGLGYDPAESDKWGVGKHQQQQQEEPALPLPEPAQAKKPAAAKKAPKAPTLSPEVAEVAKHAPQFYAAAVAIDKMAGELEPLDSGMLKMKAAAEGGGVYLKHAAAMLKPQEAKAIVSKHGSIDAAYTGLKTAAAAPTVEPPTAEEMKKASKTTSVPVPTGTSPAAKKLIEKFNVEYGVGTPTVTDPAKLGKKVAAYKKLMGDVTDANAEHAKVAKDKAGKQAAALKAQQQAEAKANAEKNKAVMADLGINEQEAEGFNALVGMLGGNQKDVVAAFKHDEQEAKAYGYPITGFQAALIKNYTDGGYSAVNKALRSGSWSAAQHVYVKMVNKALAAMPTFTGVVQRGSTLPSETQALYKVGHVVEERAFTSTSASNPFGGNTRFKITAIGKRSSHVKKLSHHGHEDEVLFQARTFFKVTKIEGKAGGQMTVHMEEMEE